MPISIKAITFRTGIALKFTFLCWHSFFYGRRKNSHGHANSVPNGDWNPGAKFWPRNFKVALKTILLKTSILRLKVQNCLHFHYIAP